MSNLIIEALKSLTSEIKTKFNVEEAAKFIVVTTSEGVELVLAGDLVVGVPVSVKDAEGVENPAMDAVYVLNDGTTIEVAGGVIKEITNEVAPDMNEEVASQLAAINQLVSMLADKFEAVNKDIDELKAKEITGFAKVEDVTDLKDTFLKLLPILEALSNTVVAPITPNKNEFKKADTKDAKLRNLADLLSKIKN